MGDDDELECVLPFDSDHPEFTRGFEAGTLWGRLEAGQRDFDAVVHASNTEMVLRIAEAHQTTVHSHDIDEDWTRVVIGP